MMEDVIIIGAGPAGLEVAYRLAKQGLSVHIFEMEEQGGGHLKSWTKLFPDFSEAAVLLNRMREQLKPLPVRISASREIQKLYTQNNSWYVEDQEGNITKAKAVVLASGFQTFDAKEKEEYGYGIYPNVISSEDYEQMLAQDGLKTKEGGIPQKVAFISCVGSRDHQSGNLYCSKICCVNGVKQAIEAKELLPEAEVFFFYMDLRMAGQDYEELYQLAQEKYGIQFIRGRVSEVAGTLDQRLQVKSEDTLLGLPLKVTVDLLVLLVGMQPSEGTKRLCEMNQLSAPYGFAAGANAYLADNKTKHEGLFLAGSCKRPMSLPETITDARAAVLEVLDYCEMS